MRPKNPQCEGIKETKKIKKYNQIMNKILKNAADSTLGARSYETPAVTVMEVMSEGVLCMSGQGDFNELDYQDGLNGW